MSAVPCGTPGGYFVHLRAKEPACRPCRKAKAAAKWASRAAHPKTRPSPSPPEQPGGALCGGPPTVTIHCPEPRCPRVLGPYYSATSADARAALATHMHRHAAVWTAGVGA